MRGIRKLVCSKAFALGVLCAYASVAAVFLTIGRTTLSCGYGGSNVHIQEAARTSLFINTADDDDGEGTSYEVNSESIFMDDVEETELLEEGLGDIADDSAGSVGSTGEEQSVIDYQDSTAEKVELDDANATKRTEDMVSEALSLAAVTEKNTTSVKQWLEYTSNMTTGSMQLMDESNPTTVKVVEPTPAKERLANGVTTTEAYVRVVDNSVVEPTVPIELRTEKAVTIETHNGLNTRCGRENSVTQHGLDCKRRIPKVIGIGMERCGTTALSFLLRVHPDIVHVKPKDVYYWNHFPDRSLDWYRDRMPISSKYQVTMEYTPSYILSHEVPHLINEAFPDMKFIVMIRDPIERAMSSYLYMRHSRRPEYLTYISPQPGDPANPFLGLSFEETVLKQNGDVFEDNAVIENALYESHLRRWFNVFPRKQFLIIDEGVFSRDPVSILQQVEDFIGISKFFTNYYFYFDHDRGVFCQRVPTKRCSKRSIKNNHPPIQENVLKKLRAYYQPYNTRLEKLLNRTFPWT